MRSLELVKSIEDSLIRVEELRELGSELAKIQKLEEARAVWEQAEAEACIIEQHYARTNALRELATALIQAQQWKQAEAVVRMIDERKARGEGVAELDRAVKTSGGGSANDQGELGQGGESRSVTGASNGVDPGTAVETSGDGGAYY